MRTLFLALLLTLAFAGSARAQQQVRTGPLPAATASMPRPGRPVPARAIRQSRSPVRAMVPGIKARLRAVSGARTLRAPRVKRPAPRG